ncbi:MAG: SCO family protein, partial [Planctomycetota bacterium]
CWLAVLMLCMMGMNGGTASAEVYRDPPERQLARIDQKLGEKIPGDLVLIRDDGREVKSSSLFEGQRPKIVTLNYSDCPKLCSMQLNALASSLNQLDLRIGRDFDVITVSIDPTETTDKTAKTKKRYVDDLDQQPGAADGWRFYTADQETIDTLTDSLGFRYAFDPVIKEYNHAAMLAFLTPDGTIALYSLKVDFPVGDLKLALIDAGQGTVGSPVDQFIMWCYSYDPERGRYTPVAWKLMRAGAALTVVLLGLTLAPFWFTRKASPPSQADTDASVSDGSAAADIDDDTIA